MVSKTDDIPASVPNCNPVDIADEAGDGAHSCKESSKTGVKDSCCGESNRPTSSVINPSLHNSECSRHINIQAIDLLIRCASLVINVLRVALQHLCASVFVLNVVTCNPTILLFDFRSPLAQGGGLWVLTPSSFLPIGPNGTHSKFGGST